MTNEERAYLDVLVVGRLKLKKENARLMSEMGHIKKENKLLNKKVIEQEAIINEMKCCKNCLYENDDEELVEQMKTNIDFCFDCKKYNRKNWRLYK